MSARFQVHIDSLTKTYEDRTVLSVDSLTLDAGVLYALIGSNGSGKSTLLRALAGTAGISSGTISVSGERTKDQVTVGYMPQKPYVFGFSVFRNVSLAIPAGTCSAQEAKERVQHALEEVGMERMQQAHGNTLSGGEAQRVALARILVRDLDVVLLDEPTASMDVEGTLQVERPRILPRAHAVPARGGHPRTRAGQAHCRAGRDAGQGTCGRGRADRRRALAAFDRRRPLLPVVLAVVTHSTRTAPQGGSRIPL